MAIKKGTDEWLREEWARQWANKLISAYGIGTKTSGPDRWKSFNNTVEEYKGSKQFKTLGLEGQLKVRELFNKGVK